jgi:nucleotide-binding universal stress UspA family protein
MPGFHKILVGVDLTTSEKAGVATLDSVAANAVRQAQWMARASHGQLTILSACCRNGDALEEAALLALASLVRQAGDEGIDARTILVPGHGWFEIIRQVQQHRHDLVVVGTHDPRGLKRLLLGSTARKLLHECPCPVWVSKPGSESFPRHILIASDLSPLSDEVVRVGVGLGHLAGA